MSLKKTFAKDEDKCTVTFTVEAEAALDAKKVYLVGEFNGWDETSLPMKKNCKTGTYSLKKELATNKEYQFRYLICKDDGIKWDNDWKADKYVRSELANDDNSVVSTYKPEPKKTAKKPAPKKACKK